MHSHTSGALASCSSTSPDLTLWQPQASFPDGRVSPLLGYLATTKAQALIAAAGLIKAFPKDFAGAEPDAVPHAPLPPTALLPLVFLADGSSLELEGCTFDNGADCMEYARTWAEDRGIDYDGVGNRRVVLALEGLQ